MFNDMYQWKQFFLCSVVFGNAALLIFLYSEFIKFPPITFLRQTDDGPNKSLEFASSNSTDKLNILIMFYRSVDTRYVKSLPSECGNCDISYNVSKLEDNSTKALVFHFNDAIKKLAPKKRRTDQYYVWFTMEGPVAIYHVRHMDLKEFDGYFNLTMSYRRDSDVYQPFGTTLDIRKSRNDLPLSQAELDTWVKRKSKVALWVVSNCGRMKHAQLRKKYVMDLKKAGLEVELGGSCFRNKKADFENHKFKFYLAFENAWHCKDYITEKFWMNSLKNGVVPVVLGAPKPDYELVAPSPNSFIYAGDFPTPRHLADYLNYLDKNDTAYKEYLNWMTLDGKTVKERERVTGYCQLCRILHGINVDNLYNPHYETKYKHIPLYQHPDRPRVVPSLYDWFYGLDYQKCLDVSGLGT